MMVCVSRDVRGVCVCNLSVDKVFISIFAWFCPRLTLQSVTPVFYRILKDKDALVCGYSRQMGFISRSLALSLSRSLARSLTYSCVTWASCASTKRHSLRISCFFFKRACCAAGRSLAGRLGSSLSESEELSSEPSPSAQGGREITPLAACS
jgi:hypothetical protein